MYYLVNGVYIIIYQLKNSDTCQQLPENDFLFKMRFNTLIIDY